MADNDVAVVEEPIATEPPAPAEMTDEALAKTIHDKLEAARGELAATEGEEGAEPKAEANAAAKGEAPKSEEGQGATEPPFTAEQMADPAFFDSLGKDGWARLEKFNPALFKMGKAVASARGKAYAEVQKLKAQEPQPKAEEAPKSRLTPEMKAAWDKKQSLDPEEAIEGELEWTRLTQEASRDPEEVVRQNLSAAFRVAAGELPELVDLSDAELDAAVEGDDDLLEALELASTLPKDQQVRLVANVMRRAGKIVLSNRATKAAADKTEADKKAADDKKAESQKRLKDNQNNASETITKGQTGAKTAPADLSDASMRASIAKRVAEAARKAS